LKLNNEDDPLRSISIIPLRSMRCLLSYSLRGWHKEREVHFFRHQHLVKMKTF